mmetsp:Transcript_2537/g.5801  ORF Transcript_2537/g.5801 Transcript_2537/m.5801 type:complete len:266 (+) Transcript_2537:1447-2244(+)
MQPWWRAAALGWGGLVGCLLQLQRQQQQQQQRQRQQQWPPPWGGRQLWQWQQRCQHWQRQCWRVGRFLGRQWGHRHQGESGRSRNLIYRLVLLLLPAVFHLCHPPLHPLLAFLLPFSHSLPAAWQQRQPWRRQPALQQSQQQRHRAPRGRRLLHTHHNRHPPGAFCACRACRICCRCGGVRAEQRGVSQQQRHRLALLLSRACQHEQHEQQWQRQQQQRQWWRQWEWEQRGGSRGWRLCCAHRQQASRHRQQRWQWGRGAGAGIE